MVFLLLASLLLQESTPKASLWERDSESWFQNGVRLVTGGVLLKMGASFESVPVGGRQRFNPSVMAHEAALSYPQLFLYLPVHLGVELTSETWVYQGATLTHQTFSVRLGENINPGTRVNAPEALHWVVTRCAPYEIGWMIAARELSPPVRGYFIVRC